MRNYLQRLCLLFVGLITLFSCERDEPKSAQLSLASTMWSGELYTRNRDKEFYVAYTVEVLFKEDGKADLSLYRTNNAFAGGWIDTPYTYKGKVLQFPREEYPPGYGYITKSWLVAEQTKDYMLLVQEGATKKLILRRIH